MFNFDLISERKNKTKNRLENIKSALIQNAERQEALIKEKDKLEEMLKRLEIIAKYAKEISEFEI